MTSQSRKHRGYASQKIVADYLRAHGWDNALPVGAGRDGSDVTGIPGLDIEIKARTKLNLSGLMKQLRERKLNTGMGVGILRLNGQGEAAIQDWVAVLRLEDLVYLLKASGYGRTDT
jgi:hypothetical protein